MAPVKGSFAHTYIPKFGRLVLFLRCYLVFYLPSTKPYVFISQKPKQNNSGPVKAPLNGIGQVGRV